MKEASKTIEKVAVSLEGIRFSSGHNYGLRNEPTYWGDQPRNQPLNINVNPNMWESFRRVITEAIVDAMKFWKKSE